jgi:hypothetical protein
VVGSRRPGAGSGFVRGDDSQRPAGAVNDKSRYCPDLDSGVASTQEGGGTDRVCRELCRRGSRWSTSHPCMSDSGKSFWHFAGVVGADRGELGEVAAINPASGSRPTTAKPPAPSLAPARQGSEAVLGSLAPLCPGSIGQPQAADRVAQGVGVIQRRQPLWRSNRRWVVRVAIHGRLEPRSQVGIRSKATKPLQQSGKRRSQKHGHQQRLQWS